MDSLDNENKVDADMGKVLLLLADILMKQGIELIRFSKQILDIVDEDARTHCQDDLDAMQKRLNDE